MEGFVDASASKSNPARVQAVDWLLRLEASPADRALREAFERWLAESEAHRAAFEAAQVTWGCLGKLPHDLSLESLAPAGRAPAVAVPRGGQQAGIAASKPRRRARTFWTAAGALAAACLLLVAVPILRERLAADHVTGVAELRDVTLPDGSVAALDANSAISVEFDEGTRAVTLLSGQAFFQVVPDVGRPFRVTAGEVSVRVTGTSFSVDKLAGAVAVAVQSGTVEVTVPGPDPVSRLGMGDRLVFDRRAREVRREQVAPTMVDSWRAHRLVVHDATAGEMVEVLGRYLPGVIVVRDPSWNRASISGVFDLSHPQEALTALAESQHARLTRITPYLSVISSR